MAPRPARDQPTAVVFGKPAFRSPVHEAQREFTRQGDKGHVMVDLTVAMGLHIMYILSDKMVFL